MKTVDFSSIFVKGCSFSDDDSADKKTDCSCDDGGVNVVKTVDFSSIFVKGCSFSDDDSADKRTDRSISDDGVEYVNTVDFFSLCSACHPAPFSVSSLSFKSCSSRCLFSN